MSANLWMRCPKCGRKIDVEEQLIELGIFDDSSGEATFFNSEDEGWITDAPIACRNCGKIWSFYIDPMVPPKKTIAKIRADYPDSIDGAGSPPLPENVYLVPEELKSNLREELRFAYCRCVFEEGEDGCLCRTDCPAENFRKIYARSVCAKQTQESGRLTVMAEEADNQRVLNFLQGCYQMEDYSILPEENLPVYRMISGKAAARQTYWYTIPEELSLPISLLHELEIRNYSARIFDAAEGFYCAVDDCPQELFKQICDRAGCIMKSSFIACITVRESQDQYLRHILMKKYHFTANLILEEIRQDASGEEEQF